MTGYTPTPDYYNDYIAHYGVKGMKWGKRKAKIKSDLKWKSGKLKGKLLEAQAKIGRKKQGWIYKEHPEYVSGNKGRGHMPNPGYDTDKKGRPASNELTPGSYMTKKNPDLQKGIQAGRQRAGIKKYGGGENWNPKTNDEYFSKEVSKYNTKIRNKDVRLKNTKASKIGSDVYLTKGINTTVRDYKTYQKKKKK